MKSNIKLSLFALMLMVLVTTGCGTSSRATPPFQENAAPAATPEPLPDLSTARISLDELPAGFEEIDMTEIIEAQKASGDEEFLPDAFFTFLNKSDFQVVMGMNFLLVDVVDRLGFKSALSNAEDTLPEFAGALGGANIREQKVLDGFETLGEKQTAMTMLSDVEGVPMRVDGVMFQRGTVGSILLSMSVEGETATISLEELGTLLGQHIQESLAASE